MAGVHDGWFKESKLDESAQTRARRLWRRECPASTAKEEAPDLLQSQAAVGINGLQDQSVTRRRQEPQASVSRCCGLPVRHLHCWRALVAEAPSQRAHGVVSSALSLQS